MAAADADIPVQFNHLQSAINVVSENQAQLGHAVRAIQSKDRLRDCKDSEEQEGRLNCNMLNCFIVIGGPYFDPGPNLQQNLQDQVCCQIFSILLDYAWAMSILLYYVWAMLTLLSPSCPKPSSSQVEFHHSKSATAQPGVDPISHFKVSLR